MDRDPTRIGPGAFVAVVGPSGAGKDTLIAYAKDRLAHRPGLVFVRRTVTRPCDAGTEEHETLTPAEFERVAAAGGFALHWTAHGHRYGLPVTLDRTIAAGGAAVANASCGMIGAIRARYERPVIVLVTARPDVLAARLAARGRESAPEVARLLRRLEDEPVAGADVVRSENDGPVERAGEAFVRTVEDALSAGRSGIARNAV